jgi:cell division protease FtsH
MVMEWGMSTKLGPIALGKKHEQVFLGRDIMEERNYSEEVASQIDTEVRGIIDSCYAASYNLLETNIDKLHRLAEALLEHETVEGDDVDRLLSDAPAITPVRKPEAVVPEQAAAAAAQPKEEKPRKAGGALPFPPPEPA